MEGFLIKFCAFRRRSETKAKKGMSETMNVYDTANNLAEELKKSKEYLDYKKAKEEINQDPEMKKKIEEFEKIRYDAQVLSMKGEKNEEKMKKLQELYQMLVENKGIKEYFDLEVKFNVLLSDVNKIIGEAVKDVLV